MDNFLIGQYGIFDEKKQSRDYRSMFWGIEACMLGSEEEVEKLYEWKREHGRNIGIHFPLRAGRWEHRDPQYLSNSVDVRETSYMYMEREFRFASRVQPEYILVHYPKPVILDDHVEWFDWNWKFGHESEYMKIDELNEAMFKERSETFFEWFSQKAQEYGFKPVIELDAVPLYLSKTEFLFEMLDRYPMIEVCMDLGRLHLQESIDDQFDSFDFLRRIADRVAEVHLWNIQVTDRVSHSHYPALPSLEPSEGWADIKKYLEILREKNQPFRILFEHNSSAISDSELEECYDWIDRLYQQPFHMKA